MAYFNNSFEKNGSETYIEMKRHHIELQPSLFVILVENFKLLKSAVECLPRPKMPSP